MNIQEEWELHKPKKKTWGRFLRVIFRRTTFVITALLIQFITLLYSFQSIYIIIHIRVILWV